MDNSEKQKSKNLLLQKLDFGVSVHYNRKHTRRMENIAYQNYTKKCKTHSYGSTTYSADKLYPQDIHGGN